MAGFLCMYPDDAGRSDLRKFQDLPCSVASPADSQLADSQLADSQLTKLPTAHASEPWQFPPRRPPPLPTRLLPHSAHPPGCSWAHTPLPARALRLSRSHSLPIQQSDSALPLTPHGCVLPTAAEASPRQHQPPASWPRHLHQPRAIQFGHSLSSGTPATWPPRYLGRLSHQGPSRLSIN